MTTKIRIIMGFSLVIIILVVMAVFGFISLQSASSNFNDYRRLANVNVDASDLQSATYETVYYAQIFLDERKPEQIKEAQARLQKGVTFVEQIGINARLESTVNNLKLVKEAQDNTRARLTALEKDILSLDKLFTEDCLPHMKAVEEAMQRLMDQQRDAQNSDGLYYLNQEWIVIGSLRENLKLYLTNMDAQASDNIRADMKSFEKALSGMGGVLRASEAQKYLASISSDFRSLQDGFGKLLATGKQARDGLAELTRLSAETVRLATEINRTSDELMRTKGPETLASNETAQISLLVVSMVGLLIGIIFAIYTIVALVRTLGKMSLFASDIANGNFDSAVNITEKGEIGAMFLAVRKIPEIFSGVIARCNAIANDISSGLFRDRLDTDRFNGGFKDLAQGINTIADAYTRTIDNLPVAIVSLDTQRKTRFSNETGAKMVGDDALRAFGGSMPLFDACIRDNRTSSAEAQLTSPEGRRLDVAATALPLRNLNGEVVGGLEVLTDISEIKEKQNIMVRVANEASALSDRVAAASEELAAQVEEVSRGAEVQRERVDATAGAMAEMNATVSEVARSAAEASDQSKNTKDNAESGAQIVSRSIAAIDKMNAVAERLQGNMKVLGEKAESIGSVMGVISDIADQTNLLALNAAIEAARAGEAGRGFAVVADEVRKLAENTMNATREVGESINAIQESTKANIQEVAIAVESVSEATALAGESGEALKGIVSLADSTSTVVTSIATAAEEQSAASDEITQSVEEINRLVTETAEGMLQSAEAVQDLSRTAQELRRVMEGLR